MCGDGTLNLWFQLHPVPASRPRVPRFGKPYYVGRYKKFRAEFAKILDQLEFPFKDTHVGAYQVDLQLWVKRPKKTARLWPLGDNDNYEKAVWDCLTKRAWDNDDAIILNRTYKGYAKGTLDDPEEIVISIRPLTAIPTKAQIAKLFSTTLE